MLKYASFDALLRAAEIRGWGQAQMPRLVRLRKGDRIILAPWDPEYRTHSFEMNTRRAELLPPGAGFSRMLLREGVWRPVAAD